MAVLEEEAKTYALGEFIRLSNVTGMLIIEEGSIIYETRQGGN